MKTWYYCEDNGRITEMVPDPSSSIPLLVPGWCDSPEAAVAAKRRILRGKLHAAEGSLGDARAAVAAFEKAVNRLKGEG